MLGKFCCKCSQNTTNMAISFIEARQGWRRHRASCSKEGCEELEKLQLAMGGDSTEPHPQHKLTMWHSIITCDGNSTFLHPCDNTRSEPPCLSPWHCNYWIVPNLTSANCPVTWRSDKLAMRSSPCFNFCSGIIPSRFFLTGDDVIFIYVLLVSLLFRRLTHPELVASRSSVY